MFWALWHWILVDVDFEKQKIWNSLKIQIKKPCTFDFFFLEINIILFYYLCIRPYTFYKAINISMNANFIKKKKKFACKRPNYHTQISLFECFEISDVLIGKRRTESLLYVSYITWLSEDIRIFSHDLTLERITSCLDKLNLCEGKSSYGDSTVWLHHLHASHDF